MTSLLSSRRYKKSVALLCEEDDLPDGREEAIVISIPTSSKGIRSDSRGSNGMNRDVLLRSLRASIYVIICKLRYASRRRGGVSM